MAFTLRVMQAGDEPELLSFDGGEVRLGRTADNDVVIKDPSSSRSHARVYEEGGEFFVEDLKSANGTTLNKRPLSAPVKLKAGDKIAIGEVVLEFSAGGPASTLDGEGDDEKEEEKEEEEDEKDAAPPRRPPSKPATAAVPRRKLTDPGKEAFEPTAPKGRALVARPPSRSLAAPAASPDALAAAPTGADATEEGITAPTAAERARERRELQRSSMGRVQVLWAELPRPTQIVVGIVGVLATLGVLGALVSAVLPKRTARKIEISELTPNGEAIAASYGEGDGVDFSRPDMKSFTFTFIAPTAIVGVLHYQARDISKDEVSIELNGAQLGSVPADTLEPDRQLELVLPSTELRLNEPNEVVFDNVLNPPASDPWRVSNVWVEVIPVPKLSSDEAGRRAKDHFIRGGRLFDLREVGSMNLFRSWKEYRDAWLLLEATPDRPDELLQTARARMREIRPMLDKKCAGMLVSYQREANRKVPDVEAARRILQDIPSYFEKEHPCFNMGRAMMAELEEIGIIDQ